MATHVHHDTCGTSNGCAVPSEFVRLRYFFGQRLGVVDLFDEQHYHAGKQRFHNLRGHGAGVLCGLTAERFAMPGTSTPTTVLRVMRGAALDPCGREIVVNVDQCIDVAAWFQKHRERLAWTAGDHALTVALCYRECASNPAPAPRDPCGCDAGGCELGRVREGFELKLLTDEEAEHLFDETFPTRAALHDALGAADLGDAIDTAVGAACPNAPDEACLALATFTVTLGDDPLRVTAIGDPDSAIPRRASLLSTAALQELVLRIANESTRAGALGPGPALGAVAHAIDGGQNQLEIAVALAADVPLAEATLGGVEVHRFDANQWQAAEPVQVSYETSGGAPRIRVRWTAAQPTEGNYRLTIAPPFERPIVDRTMRPLSPARFAFAFSLRGNPLTLGSPSF